MGSCLRFFCRTAKFGFNCAKSKPWHAQAAIATRGFKAMGNSPNFRLPESATREAPPAANARGDLDGLLSAKRVRDLLDCPDRTLRRWISAGLVPRHDLKIGTTLRWKVSTIRDFIDGNAPSAKPRKPIRLAPRAKTRTS